MNGYLCFYKDKKWEVYADTKAEAHKKAVAHFKAKKSWEVDCYLAEKDGEQVTTTLTNPRRKSRSRKHTMAKRRSTKTRRKAPAKRRTTSRRRRAIPAAFVKYIKAAKALKKSSRGKAKFKDYAKLMKSISRR